MNKDCETGLTSFFYSKTTKKSKAFADDIKKAAPLVSYLKILIAFILMLYNKADSPLLRYSMLKYKLSLYHYYVVCLQDIFVKSTLRSNYP